MPQVNDTTLKGYFEDGDVPTEAQFIDLIDSKFSLTNHDTDDISEGAAKFVTETEKNTWNAKASAPSSLVIDNPDTPTHIISAGDVKDGTTVIVRNMSNDCTLEFPEIPTGARFYVICEQDDPGGDTLTLDFTTAGAPGVLKQAGDTLDCGDGLEELTYFEFYALEGGYILLVKKVSNPV